MTKAEIRGLFKQRVKLLRVTLFGPNDYFSQGAVQQELDKQLRQAAKKTTDQLNKKYAKELAQVSVLLKKLHDEASKTENVTLHVPSRHSSQDSHFSSFVSVQSGDVSKIKFKFEIKMLELEEKLLTDSAGTEAAKLLQSLPTGEDLLKELLN